MSSTTEQARKQRRCWWIAWSLRSYKSSEFSAEEELLETFDNDKRDDWEEQILTPEKVNEDIVMEEEESDDTLVSSAVSFVIP